MVQGGPEEQEVAAARQLYSMAVELAELELQRKELAEEPSLVIQRDRAAAVLHMD